MRRIQLDPRIAELILGIARGHSAFDAIAMLAASAGVIARYAPQLSKSERVELSEYLRDVSDHVEHWHEPAKV